MISVDLVTGFLGAGKTTFIKKYVSFLLERGERIGILENDYGAINVDMILLGELRGADCELEMVAGGCDADCYIRRFKTKLISMAMSGYSRVVIEPSGIFDINVFYDVLRDEPLDTWYEIGNVFCIVDAGLDCKISLQTKYILDNQVRNSGCVVLSRTGEVDKNSVVRTEEFIAGICANTLAEGNRILAKDWNEFTSEDFEALLNVGYKIYDAPKKYNFDELDFDTLIYMESGINLEQMQQLTHRLFEISERDSQRIGRIFRVKGFVPNPSEGEGWIELNATHNLTRVSKINSGQPVFIIIGENMNKEEINQIVNSYIE